MTGLSAMPYCTPQGGSGYIPSSQVPTLSTYVVTQNGPVYDQTTAWLREQPPGTYTNYPDVSVLPPGADGYPSPVATCGGMGDLYLRRADVVAPLPSIVDTANSCQPVLASCPGDVSTWISNNPVLFAAVALVGVWALFGRKRA